MSININPNKSNDINYRYKMESIKIQNITNFTILKNINLIAESTSTPQEIIIKFISIVLGCIITKDRLAGNYTCDEIQKIIF